MGMGTWNSHCQLLGIAALVALLAVSLPLSASAQGAATYEITVTNLTRDQRFTPILFVTHAEGVHVFQPGSEASSQLETLAEEGGTAPLSTLLAGTPGVLDMMTSAGLLEPGDSVSVRVRGGGRMDRLSLVSMMIPTNDGFIGINGAKLPRGRETLNLVSPGYDAGTERNDELCLSMPGPGPIFTECGPGPGGGGAPEGMEEGHVHVHGGIHGIRDLNEAQRDWRNPVARIAVRRVH